MNWFFPTWTLAPLAFVAGLIWLLLVWLHTRIWVRRLHLGLPYALVETILTPDGGSFELRRIADLPNEDPPAIGSPPVLLVHGICANHRNQDIHPDHSIARYLTERGRDVWLLTLRSGRRWTWRERSVPMGFDAMVRYDLPLAVQYILDHTGAAAIDYVAFSMGGMLLYASLGKTIPESSVRRAAFVGSPGKIIPYYRVPRFVGRIPRRLTPRLLSRIGARSFAFLSEWFVTPLHRQITNPRNLSPGITRLALVDCIEDVPGELLSDFIGWATDSGTVRLHGEDILHSIHHLKQPALFIAGAADHIGSVPAVRAAYDAWGSQEASTSKQFMVLGKAGGAVADYGHGDLAMGARINEELHPLIEKFLSAPNFGIIATNPN